ncbi:hypothetical protein BJY16_005864 [Actinoplanes octamycinicus]|uniref:Uncharacterized protein n=1 Tax=Actinoplanes octamycinicus TaxID=135948 RepID=A0A7W7H1S2_9ACTN|nr:hypothetical protein [Actinoplanes octamycinicus]MBB4742405.1 hypothetical protein [Actinoplanes octamycinicus]GIE62345.1 hypothetical protein Aoc01nite_77470 [Actinoplanes octamycinicus]
MVRDGVAWFGEFSAAQTIAVAEPPGCAHLRATVAGNRRTIEALTEDNRRRAKAPPQDKGQYTARIQENNEKIEDCRTAIGTAMKQGTDLGCQALG